MAIKPQHPGFRTAERATRTICSGVAAGRQAIREVLADERGMHLAAETATKALLFQVVVSLSCDKENNYPSCFNFGFVGAGPLVVRGHALQ